jgi:hypothetical protein
MIRRERSALMDMIGAFHERYTDEDFGYDPKSGRDRRREFTDAGDAANKRFDELITGAALNSTLACHVCLLVGVYEKARRVGEGDKVTLEELERFPDWFSMAADQDQIDRKSEELRHMGGRDEGEGRFRDFPPPELPRPEPDHRGDLLDGRNALGRTCGAVGQSAPQCSSQTLKVAGDGIGLPLAQGIPLPPREFRPSERGEGDERSRLQDTIDTLRRDIEQYKRRLADFRHSPNWDPNSPKMSVEKDKYICEHMPP